jgi:hypothetical protein
VKVSGVVAATRIGGWGCWYGFGVSVTLSTVWYLPWYEKLGSVQAFWMIASASANRSRLSAYGMP